MSHRGGNSEKMQNQEISEAAKPVGRTNYEKNEHA